MKNMKSNRGNRNYLVISAVAVILALVLALAVGRVSVSGKEKNPTEKLVTTVTVAYGDTLWEIAERYHSEECGSVADYVTEIKACNQMWDDEIRAGESIVVPYWSQK